MSKPISTTTRNSRWWTILFVILFLGPSMFGFVTKFLEFVHTFVDDEAGVFAITPMVNYLLASLGFLCLLVWASRNGMFQDLEEPKIMMLKREQLLDRDRSTTPESMNLSRRA